MWETVISWYLNNYLGKYVEDLNAQQLSFALRQGELELENVPLKKNIFRNWGLPVEVRSGVVGRIKIEFNIFKYLRNEPVLISIEDIYLVAGALNLAEWDPVLEDAVAHETKMSSLDSQEARWKAQFDLASNSSSYYSSLYFSSVRIGASIVTKVVENLHLNVRNVHIRFEEEIGCRSRVFAVGLTLGSLTGQSCDSRWNPLSSSPGGNGTELSFKILHLNKFDIYCDTKGERFSDVRPQELKEAMSKHSISHEYVLCPVSAEARIAKNNWPHPLTSSSQPRFDVQLSLDKFQVQLTDSQYRSVVRAYKSFRRLSRNCRLRHCRPFVPVTRNSLEWWNYAVKAVLLILGYKRRKVLKTWEDVLQRGKDNVAYVQAYEQHLLRELPASDIGKTKDRLELELHYEEILALREVAMRRVEIKNEKFQGQSSNSTSKQTEKNVEKEGGTSVSSSDESTHGKNNGGTLFSYYFPSITKWISGSGTAASTSISNVDCEEGSSNSLPDVCSQLQSKPEEDMIDEKLQLRKSESEFDEAILDDVRAFGRDALLARFKFVLKHGVVNLNKKTGPFLELDVGSVEIQAELKPRSGSHKFKMTLASLFLQDCSTKSIVVSPHAANKVLLADSSGARWNKSESALEPIFNIIYERKPYKKVGHRVSITTRPLDLVIYPILWESVGDYFNIPDSQDELILMQNGYEAMKQKTKEELRIHWEKLIHHRSNSNSGGDSSLNWEINFDISAPQIVIYDSKHFKYTSTSDLSKRHPTVKRQLQRESTADRFVVVDLGRFRFTNTNCDKNKIENLKGRSVGGGNFTSDSEDPVGLEDNDNYEEFLTPCSSPVENGSYSSSPRQSIPDINRYSGNTDETGLERSDSLGDLQAKLYKKYRLEINDVQVIVVDGKTTKNGAWKAAISRGASILHLVDRFSINLQFERRLIFSEDPLWPSLALVATLPKLNLHFNESKILTVQSVLNSFLLAKPASRVEQTKLPRPLSRVSQGIMDESMLDGNTTYFNGFLNRDQSERTLRAKNLETNSDCKLFLAQFTIQQVTVEIQSRGRSVAELQISGARTTFTKRTGDTSISFVIHSLLLVDAVQTFGPDFELLLASHKHVSMDSVSGSLIDSEPTSPMSPQSPSSPVPFAHERGYDNHLSIPTQLQEALLLSLQNKRCKSSSSLGIQSPVYDTEALITAELMIVPDDNGEDLVVLSIQFNSLDVIANQETMVEIMQFIQNVTPAETVTDRDLPQGASNYQLKTESSTLLSPKGGRKIKASFDFNRLSVLLMRGFVGKDGSHCARKIATATASDARVSFGTGDDCLDIKGFLGGLQILNLTPEGQHHQRVLSVGKDPLVVSTNYNVFTPAKSLDKIINGLSYDSALTFSYEEIPSNDSISPVFALKVASVIYTHCPVFLIDLQKCVSQFQAPITKKLKSAAAQIALGLVRQDSVYGLGNFRSPLGSLSSSLDRLNLVEDDIRGRSSSADPKFMYEYPGIKLDIVLDSPVLVLPRNRTSSEVLVGNLGQITIQGSKGKQPEQDNDIFSTLNAFQTLTPISKPLKSKRNLDAVNYNALICDISIYSLNLQERWAMIDNLNMTCPTANYSTLMRAQELYYCDPAIAKPILHNTVIQFNIDYMEETNLDMNPPKTRLDEKEFCGPKLEIQGCVVNPLKVSLTPQQYSQVLDSINNVAAGEDDFYKKEINVNTLDRRMHWEKEVAAYDQKLTSDQLPLPSPTTTTDDSLRIVALFEIPELIVELVFPDDTIDVNSANSIEVPHLSLSCSDFSFDCDKVGYLTEIKICLKSLILEDTSVPLDSPQRVLAVSKPAEESYTKYHNQMSTMFNRTNYLSTSCPDLPKTNPVGILNSTPSSFYCSPSLNVARTESSSLPDHLDPNDIFSGRFFPPGMINKKGTRTRRMSSRVPDNVRETLDHRSDSCPLTPPPSPRPLAEHFNNLVQIQISLIDQKSPYFITKHKGTHKVTDVEFNTLEVLLTPCTFVRLRRFFTDASESDGSSKMESIQRKLTKTQTQIYDKGKILIQGANDTSPVDTTMEHQNSETQINVKALRVKLGDPKGTVAQATVGDVSCHLVNREEFFGIDGRLGLLEVRDVSRHAGLYPVKFVFQGKQALDFDYSRRGTEANFRLEMASVVCVHTNRFYTEFSNLLSALFFPPVANPESFQIRTADKYDLAHDLHAPVQTERNIRVSLCIQAGAPVLLFPYSSSSNSILVADLGHLSVRNKFVEETSTNILDCIFIDLIEMDLYSAILEKTSDSRTVLKDVKSWRLDDHWIVMKTENSPSLLKNKCALNLKMKRLLSRTSSTKEPNTIVQGTLSTVYITLDPEKYKLIRGLLEFNIGENIVKDVTSITPARHRRPSFLNSSSGAGTTATISQLDLAIELDLVNVTVELVKEHGLQLSRIDFLKSEFKFLSNVDGTKDYGLVSHKILIRDVRNNSESESTISKNVFASILQQTSTLPSVGHPIDGEIVHSGTEMQAEVHFRQTQRGLSVSLVLSNIRLMLILDWWMEVHSFIFKQILSPPSLISDVDLTIDDSKKCDINVSPLLSRSKQLISPVTVSAGIVTKRAPILDVPVTTFELKINVFNCELVVVEDPSVWDTNAVILKITATMTYRPHLERPVSCNILQSELFSCILGLESETALSILDPTSVTLELVRKTKSEPQGILDATLSPSSVDKILKIQSPQLSLRLSYYDMKMFIQLLESFSKQAQTHLASSGAVGDLSDLIDLEDDRGSSPLPKGIYQRSYYFDEASVDQLLAMGFARTESEAALEKCDGRLEEAALLLSSNTSFVERKDSSGSSLSSNENRLKLKPKITETKGRDLGLICGIEVKCNCLSLCVIDDCKDADVPLVELNVNQLELSQNCEERMGRAECIFSSDYYNRELSGWEPFLEPWKCSTSWKRNECGQLGKFSPSREFPSKAPELELSLSSREVMNVNITSTLLSLYSTVSSNWTEDYRHQKVDKRRAPFVPFLVRNETGSLLWFSTILSNNEDLVRQQKQGNGIIQKDGTSWIKVANGFEQSFSFEGRGKLRHRNTHQLRTHQLAVRVDGWQQANPVSVDRVGTYFRSVKPTTNSCKYYGFQGTELPPSRLVFDVRLEGSAQKLVIIRSALMVRNMLPGPMELKLENTIVYPAFAKAQTGGSLTLQVQSTETCPIPLHSVYAQIWVRPSEGQFQISNPSLYNYCIQPLLIGNNLEGHRNLCKPLVLSSSNQVQPYHFCVAVKKDEFPADEDEQDFGTTNNLSQFLTMGFSKRANLLTLLSPLTIVNLLPQELTFDIKDHYSYRICPGKEHCITNVDIDVAVEISFQIENASQSTPISVSATSNPFVARLKFLDKLKRPLYLTARISRGDGGTIIIVVLSPYWIVNKSGLPILCKQEGTKSEAAGQFQEHELGRMVAPLLFSFPDYEGAATISLRIGAGLHANVGKPHWCRPFPPQNGVEVRKLNVALSHVQPEIVYIVGIEVKDGRGRYRDSKLITLAPRFMVDNRSSYQMQISQRSYATSFMDPAADATHLTLPPKCSLPFHWPRLDKDLLLCVRIMSIRGSLWSGGFQIENVDSFHVNVRDQEGNCYFLRVEVVLQGPTYFVIFSDTDNLPPPFRVDNLSLVPIYFHQSSVGDGRQKLMAKAESSCSYAWDEPTEPQHLTLETPGGTSTIANMNLLGCVSHVTYENFFYIALTATFPKDGSKGLMKDGLETMNLVLDVPLGSKVVLAKKEFGKRSQLWRVTAAGLIEHEGSSSPRDPRKPAQPGTMLVLDIAGQAPLPSQYSHLMLRKPDNRRINTQHWEFTKDGRLKCVALQNLYVQAKDGFSSSSGPFSTTAKPLFGAWQLWNEVALGPQELVCYTRTETGIPVEQAVGRQKLRPGSGRLTIHVDTDGPTRVLRIIDTEKPPRSLMLCHTVEENVMNTIPKMSLTVDLHSGLGASVISCNPREELIYIQLSSFHLNWSETQESETVEVTVQNLQIDNQLFEAEKVVAVYVTPPPRYDSSDDTQAQQPAVKLDWRRLKSKLTDQVLKNWELVIKPLSIILEEKLLLKLCSWCGVGKNVNVESEFEVQKVLTNTASLTARRWYFGLLRITLSQVRLSVVTSAKLPADLLMIKRHLGLPLISFEEALVELDPFQKQHPFETFEFLLASLMKHYKNELLSQALLVLGSVDFLGNPVGFVNDVSVGVSGLIHEGSFGALFKNVTHGLSNSAAKMTGSLGDGLGRTLTLDVRHEDERRKIRDEYNNSSGEQLYAGLRGFGHGFIGGLTSIFSQTYEGASNDGFTGLISGLGKGIVGTVTKPAIGVLDLAAGAASAIRDSSRTSSRIVPGRLRTTRVIAGNGGLLPPYSKTSALGQELLFEVNDRNYIELFIACETFKSRTEELKILVSSFNVTLLKNAKEPILTIPLRELLECKYHELNERCFVSTSNSTFQKRLVIEFTRQILDTNMKPPYNFFVQKPQVIVDSEQVAKKIVQQVNYAKVLFEELRHTQIIKPHSPNVD